MFRLCFCIEKIIDIKKYSYDFYVKINKQSSNL